MKSLFYMVTIAMCMAACSHEPEAASIPFGTVTVEKEVTLTADKDAPSCKVTLNVACAKTEQSEVEKAINQTIVNELFDMEGLSIQQAADSFATKYTQEYKKNLAPLYAQDKGDNEKRAWYEYHYTIDSRTQGGHDGAIVYLVDVDYYEGGAHGIKQQLSMNFNAKTGKRMTLKDVFVPGSEVSLSELLLDKLMELTGVNSIEELHAKNYLYAMDMFPSDNFILGDDEITFIYNMYEIAPYSVGKIEINLSYSDVKDLLK